MDIPESKENPVIKELKQIYYARTEPITDLSNPTSIDIHVYADSTDAIMNIKDINENNIFYIRLEPSANDGYSTSIYDNNIDFTLAIRNDMPSEPVAVTSTDPSEATTKDSNPVRNNDGVAISNVPPEPTVSEPVAPERNWDPNAALQAIKNNNTSIIKPIAPKSVAPKPITTESIAPEPIAPEPIAPEPAAVKPISPSIGLNPIILTNAQKKSYNYKIKKNKKRTIPQLPKP
jgi:hypothetical protein